MSMMTIPETIRESISHFRRNDTNDSSMRVAQALGVLSIALGIVQVVAPKFLSALTGVRRPRLMQACGVREVANGVGLLTSSQPAPWLWGRVAGDAIDLGVLTEAYLEGDDDDRKRTCISAAAVAGVTALDAVCAAKLT